MNEPSLDQPPNMDTPRSGQDNGGLAAGALRNEIILSSQPTHCKTLFDADIFKIFVHSEEIVEVRIMGIDGKKSQIISGYFDNYDVFCKAVREVDKRQHAGIYFTLHVIDPRLIGRAYNRLKPSDLTTSDRDVLFYRWLPVDLDPVRPTGVSSSDSELRVALEIRESVKEWVMHEFELSSPIKAMSGNGGHILFRLPDIPVSDQNKTIIKGMLEDISAKFSTPQVSIDTKVFNPARIWKLYGTTARKGDEVPANSYREARPHRKAYIDDLGGNHG